MKNDKSYLRKKSLLTRKENYSKIYNFNFNILFKLIKKNFLNKKINIACYYPSNYEVNTLGFIEQASKRNFKISLPVIRPLGKMSFKPWKFKNPLYVSAFGTLEPSDSQKEIIPDLVMVPLVAYDNQLNRLGYGKGYYDKILEKINRDKKKKIFVGIAYSFQKYQKIPINKHDVKLDYIFTEKGII
jgi:5-formyltetrahydrofolate cyclo-ligase